ncbi:MAG: MerR family transcriptional regulator [Chloroflexi bacterium]|nr:MerR family transcriptional regulator [Chloroflexota bacterium]
MQIGTLAKHLGTTVHTIRFYERHGFLPAADRGENGYRRYTDADLSRLRLLIGLRSLDLPLDQAATIANLCADGRCDEVSFELRAAIQKKRAEVRRRVEEMGYLENRLAHLSGQLESGAAPRPLISPGKEDAHAGV